MFQAEVAYFLKNAQTMTTEELEKLFKNVDSDVESAAFRKFISS